MLSIPVHRPKDTIQAWIHGDIEQYISYNACMSTIWVFNNYSNNYICDLTYEWIRKHTFHACKCWMVFDKFTFILFLFGRLKNLTFMLCRVKMWINCKAKSSPCRTCGISFSLFIRLLIIDCRGMFLVLGELLLNNWFVVLPTC